MTIKKLLARSNIAMFVIPFFSSAILLIIGMIICILLLETLYLPRLGISLQELHQTGEQIEGLLSGLEAFICVYAGIVIITLLFSIIFTNLYLTHIIFRRISEPLEALTAGVDRIRDGDLDTPISYMGEDEFKAACDAVDEMAFRLKASLEQRQSEQQKKRELIVGMSHDLKSPLTSIRAYTEALLDGVAGDEATKKKYLQTIYAKETDMEAMVNRLFAFAKTESGEYPINTESVPLCKAMQEITDEWNSDEMEIHTDIPESLRVMADRDLLRRIISNLLGNSQKYGGRKIIHILISAESCSNSAKITFADDGIGVPEEQLAKLFDAFYRGDAARSAPGKGSGLGLAVVKKAVEDMGGCVRAENGIGHGLSIIFTLPIDKEEING